MTSAIFEDVPQQIFSESGELEWLEQSSEPIFFDNGSDDHEKLMINLLKQFSSNHTKLAKYQKPQGFSLARKTNP